MSSRGYISVLTVILIVKLYLCEDHCGVDLNQFDVKWYRRPTGTPIETRGLNGLNEAYKIVITNNVIPELCYNAVTGLKSLRDLDMSNNDIMEIRPGAFSKLDKLADLRLNGNDIKKIVRGTFTGLSLAILRLQDNDIETIDEDAFELPSLRVLNLSNNKIKSINNGWFKHTPQIVSLQLGYNQISALAENSFKGLNGITIFYSTPSYLDIHLDNNNIKEIHPKAFNGLEELGNLYLDNNQIEDVNEDIFRDLNSISVVSLTFNRIKCLPVLVKNILKANVTYLENNPWNCDCVKNLEVQVKRLKLNVHLNYDLLKCKIDALMSSVKQIISENKQSDVKK